MPGGRPIHGRDLQAALRAFGPQGADAAAFWTDLAALGVFAAAMLALASLRLKREWT